MTFVAWPEIESFHHIRKFIKVDPGEWWHKKELFSGDSKVVFGCKIKLHGTNAAIQYHVDGNLVCQSRENIITPEKDNAGFARWVMNSKDAWVANLKERVDQSITIFGEYVGSGVQKGVAVSQIGKKVFAIFAIRPMDGSDSLIVEPEEISKMVGSLTDVYVLPWFADPDTKEIKSLAVDWKQSAEELTQTITPVNEWVAQVENCDPWVEENFGVKGTGEGLVFYPTSKAHLGWESFQNLCFKAKGEKHKNIATAKPAQVNPETATSINGFVELVLTPARLEQGAGAVGGFDLKLVGKFIQWISGDIQKECQDEMAASNLTFKQVQKVLTDKARNWYIAESKMR